MPLGEAYEVDILDGPDGGVVRTLAGLTSPAVTCAVAEQVADFGGAQPLVHVRVYQLSAVIGRGFATHASL